MVNTNQYNNWFYKPLSELIDYIIEHHKIIQHKLSKIHKLLDNILTQSDNNHEKMLRSLETVFSIFKEELIKHFKKEEKILIPYIFHLEAYKNKSTSKPRIYTSSVKNPISQMEYEHDQKENAFLKSIRVITNNYHLSKNANPKIRDLFEIIKDFDNQIQKHIYLEDKILFPRAIELELELMHA